MMNNENFMYIGEKYKEPKKQNTCQTNKQWFKDVEVEKNWYTTYQY